MPKRKQRPHGVAPAGFKFRDGRPRWEPSPTLRAAGWKGRNLQDDKGQWLSRGASIDVAESIVGAVDAWRAGDPVLAAFAAIAPLGASAAGRAAPAADHPRSIGVLLDAYLDSREFRKIGERTQPEYRSKLKRMVDVLAGWPLPPGRDADAATVARYDAARATIRAALIDALMPPAFGEDGDALLYTAYWLMRDKVGHHMANGTLAVASAWLEWCRKQKRAIQINPAQLVDRDETPGRIRVGSIPELQALIAAGEALGWHSIADSIVLGLDLSWNQGDRLNLQWPQISPEHRVRAKRRKTGAVLETMLLDGLGKPRVAAIRERQRCPLPDGAIPLPPAHVLVCESTGRKWEASHYRHTFAEVRALAVAGSAEHGLAPCPSVAAFTDQDLRDTAVTMAYEAGLDEQEIASRTGHSLKRIRDILDKHYGKITRVVGDRGAGKLNSWLASNGVTL